jgi:hypothetical protein
MGQNANLEAVVQWEKDYKRLISWVVLWGVIEKALAKQVFSVLFTLLLPLGTSSCQSVISNASLIANYFSDIMK